MKKIRLTKEQRLTILCALSRSKDYYKDCIKKDKQCLEYCNYNEEMKVQVLKQIHYEEDQVNEIETILNNIYGFTNIEIMKCETYEEMQEWNY